MDYLVLAVIFVLDFVLSLFAYSLREYSKFRLTEHADELIRARKERARRIEKQRDTLIAFFEGRGKRHLPFLLGAFLLDVAFIFGLFMHHPERAGTLGHAGIIGLVYVFTVYLFCRVLAFNIAEHRTPMILLANAGTIRLLAFGLLPLALIAGSLDRLTGRVAFLGTAGRDPEEDVEDEIKESITEGVEDGVLEEDEKRMIESILKFDDSDVKSIMTPRTDLMAIPASASLDDAINLAQESGYSRIPVYGKDIDDITGILYVKDLLGSVGRDLTSGMTIAQAGIVREAYFIPESKMVSELFREIREKKNHFAVVLDEYGGTAGIVTAEDIIEEIVGEIEDEYDPGAEEKIVWRSERTADVDARIPIDELNEAMDITLPEESDFESLGGFLAARMGKIPQMGETAHYDNLTFKVTRATKRKLLRVEIAKLTGTSEDED